ncbi:MAG: protein kinase [Isosphaeraceae bacterium]|nr:protein kinase [Isosphaeraceae bacterium]
MRTAVASLRSLQRDGTALQPTRRALESFEELWRHGGAPVLEEHWARCGADRSPTLLVELIKADLTGRFARGERPEVAAYLERFPELAAHERVLSLIYEEYCLREEVGERPDPDAFCDRYKPWRDSLASQLRYHQLLSQVVAPAASPTPQFPKPGERFLKFRLRSVLGRGGAAWVYLAHDEELGDREVALKVSLDRGKEPSIQGPLNHDGIMPVYDVRCDPQTGLRGLSMPYLPGQALDRLLDALYRPQEGAATRRPRRARELWEALVAACQAPGGEGPGPAPWDGFPSRGSFAEAAAWVVARIAEALAYAHDQGVLHRDVKPANLLLTLAKGPKLLDFNLAQAAQAEGAEAALRGGTLPYMAPEQLEAFLVPELWETIGPAADLYALGLVLRELLTGQRPEAADHKAPLPRAIRDQLHLRTQPLPAVRSLNPDVPHALDAIVARCLALAPTDRYPSAAALAEDLHRFLRRQPLRYTSNPSRAEILRNWAHRHRSALLLASALPLAGLALPRVIATALRPDAQALLEQADTLNRNGDKAAARRLYDQVRRLDPGKSQTLLDQARRSADAGYKAEACKLYRQVCQLEPDKPGGYWGLGHVSFRERDFEQSITWFNRAIAVARASTPRPPNYSLAEMYLGRAAALNQRGLQIQGASATIQSLDAAYPMYARALKDLEQARRLGGIEPFPIDFQVAVAEVGLGDVASGHDHYAESVTHYLRARQLLAAILQHRGALDEALRLRDEVEVRLTTNLPWFVAERLLPVRGLAL